jgi:hypothetical protein
MDQTSLQDLQVGWNEDMASRGFQFARDDLQNGGLPLSSGG